MELIRPETQKLQVESFLAIQGVINNMNCEFRKTDPDNASLDGEIDLVKGGNFKGKIIKSQIKAGLSYISSQTKNIVRIKVEKKYLDLWATCNFPVILLFYNPETKTAFWKSIKDYLKIDPAILKKLNKTVTIPFDKERDLLDTNVLEKWFLIADNKFEYEKVIYTEKESETVWSNWFPIIELPRFIYSAPTTYEKVGDITSRLDLYYSFTIKEKSKLFTFSNLDNPRCELSNFCDTSKIQKQPVALVDEKLFVELLNSTLRICLVRRDLVSEYERFYFDSKVLNDQARSVFSYQPIKNTKFDERAKIYRSNEGGRLELKHHAVKIRFHHLSNQWYLEIEPDWFFSYPKESAKTRREVGIRITKEKAGMFNEHYKYHLHAMKQYIADNKTPMVFLCDDLEDSQAIKADINCLTFTSNFMLFNDYNGPELEKSDDED